MAEHFESTIAEQTHAALAEVTAEELSQQPQPSPPPPPAGDDRADRLERELAELRGYVMARQPEPAPEPEPAPPLEIPDPQEDFDGYLRATRQVQERQAEATKRVEEWITGQRRRDQEREQRQALVNTISGYEQRFRQSAPDYDQALAHLASERVNDLAAFGIAPQRAQSIVTEELVALAQQAMHQRMDPAAMIYALAQRRGYSNAAVAESVSDPWAPPPRQPQRRQPSRDARAEGNMPSGSGPPASGNALQALLAADDRDIANGNVDWRRILEGAMR